MSTYGEIRHRLTILAPGVGLDKLDGWIVNRHTAILDRLKWQRQEVQSVLQTVAAYETGTIDVANGSASAIGTGTTWTSAMTGRSIRIAEDGPYYEFTYLTATTGTLDRAYEGADAADAAYRIFQNIYTLPGALRILTQIRTLDPAGVLLKKTQAELNLLAPSRNVYGTPQMWAPMMDNASDPPRPQVELYPIPTEVLGLPYTATEDADLDGSDTSVSLLPWMRPAAILAGVQADIARDMKEWVGAREYEAVYESRVADMVRAYCTARGGVQIRMAARFTRHRLARALR